MAITAPSARGNVSSGATADAYVSTVKFTPADNEHIIIWIANTIIGASGTTPSSLTGWGWTGSLITTFLDGAASPVRHSLFTVTGTGASNDSYQVNFNGVSQSACLGNAQGFAGSTGNFIQLKRGADDGANSAITVTLNAFGASGNIAYGLFRNQDATAVATAGAGMTLAMNLSRASLGRNASEYTLANDTTVDMSFSQPGTMRVLAIELEAATTGGPRGIKALIGPGGGLIG